MRYKYLKVLDRLIELSEDFTEQDAALTAQNNGLNYWELVKYADLSAADKIRVLEEKVNKLNKEIEEHLLFLKRLRAARQTKYLVKNSTGFKLI